MLFYGVVGLCLKQQPEPEERRVLALPQKFVAAPLYTRPGHTTQQERPKKT